MKILFLCHRFPYPPDHGARIRAFHFIRYLSQKHSVTLVTLAHTEQELAQGGELKIYCREVLAEVLPVSIRWSRAVAALGWSLPSSVAYFRSMSLQKRVDELLARENFDVIIVFCAFMAQYVLTWQRGYRILDYGDIDSAKWSAYSEYNRIPLSWGYAVEAAKLRKYERYVARHFHHCTVISQGEREEFDRFDVDIPCTIIPNGVDTEYFTYTDENEKSAPTIVFLGRMDYFPNVDGIEYFVREVFPLIRNKVAGIKLRIIGSNPAKSVQELAKIPNISVTGYVPDVRSHLRDAVVAIAPLRIARGTQNKILETLAMGIPTVATPEAARGVDCVPGKHLLVADGPEAFARETIKLIENEALQKNLAKAGRQQIECAYTWDRSLDKWDAILSQMPNPLDEMTKAPDIE